MLKIALRWLLRNKRATEEEQDLILSNVRFALIKPDSIMSACKEVIHELDGSEVETNFLKVCLGPIFQRHLSDAMKYHKELHKQPLMQTQTTTLRTSNSSYVSIDGVLASSAVKLPNDSKLVLSNPPTHIRDPFHSVVELNGFLFIIGGTREVDGGFR